MAGETGQVGQDGLLVLDQEGNLKKVLAEVAGPVAFCWSPDGKRVAYITAGDASSPEATKSLVVIDPRDPETSRTSIEDSVVAFFWSPNGERIAYFVPSLVLPTESPETGPSPSGPELFFNVFVLEVNSGKSLPVASFKPTENFLNFISYFDQYQRSATIWSPDSRNLVVAASRTDGGPGLFIVEASGNLQPRYLAEGVMATWSAK
jgi:TolB protein